MKILMVAFRTVWPLYMGDRMPVYYWARELKRRGHTLDLLAFAERPEDLVEQHQYAELFGAIELIPEPERMPATYTQRLRDPALHWPRRAKDAWSPEMWRAIERRLDAADYDLIQVFGGAHVYEFYHAYRGIPAVINPIDSLSRYLRTTLEHEPLTPRAFVERQAQWIIAQKYEAWMFSPYARTVTVAEGDRNELLSLNPALHVEVIPNGVDLAVYHPQAVERDPATLVFVGNMLSDFNHDAAMQLVTTVLPSVRERVPDAKLWIVGSNPRPPLQALASDPITITGHVEDVRPYLAQASAFVSPLRFGSGIKNKILEALALGCPVAATPPSVEAIAVTDGQDVLVAEVDALADAVIRLLQDAELQRRLSANGPKVIEAHYSWAHVGDQIEALYAEVLASR